MESRTAVACKCVFQALREMKPNLDPEYICCDHEIAEQQGRAFAFPDAFIVGCLWHCLVRTEVSQECLLLKLNIGTALWIPLVFSGNHQKG